MLRIFLCLLMLSSFSIFGQVVLKENLTKKKTTYWDFNKTKKQSVGAYYKDQLGETDKQHGKWEYFDQFGNLQEVRNYYRGKLNGAVILKYGNGKMKQEGYFKNDKLDSIYREWNELGFLVLEGNYENNKQKGIWKSFYNDGRPKMTEEVIDSSRYVQSFWLPDSLNRQTIIDGTGVMTISYNNGALKEWYNYKSGVLDGEFEERSILGHQSLTGSYIQGRKTGEWKYFYYTGDIEKICNYEADKLDGVYKYFYDNGKLNVEGLYKKGLKQGTWTWYTNKGTRDMSGNFKEDLQDGDWTYWFPEGGVSYTAQYKAGLKHGNWNYFYKDGSKFKKGSFTDDQKDGLWETWYENGTLLMTGKYMAGKEEGKWSNFWENGKVKNESSFKHGTLHGTWKSFNPKGTLKLTGTYKDGYKSKEWTEYFDNGKPKDIYSYKVVKTKSKIKYGPMKGRVHKESVKNGHATSFSAKDFGKTEEGDYKNGERHGEWTAYYPGGKVPAVVSNYKNGKLDGRMREYGRRGELTTEIYYKDGLKHGTFKTFDKRGKVLSEREFEYGMQVVKTTSGGGFTPKR